MTTTQIRNFAAFVCSTHIGYDEVAKDIFRRDSMAILRQVAKAMGLAKGTYAIRFNAGGIAVSGDAVLHSDHLYINMSQMSHSNGSAFMYRSCNGQKDYTGGHNRWMKYEDLVDFDSAIEKLKLAAAAPFALIK